jgi:hypothetical protein
MRNVRRVLLTLGVSIVLAGGHSRVSSEQADRPAGAPPTGVVSELGRVSGESDPKVYVDSAGTVYRLWIGDSTGKGGDIRFQRSVDGGRTWTAAPVTLDRGKPPGARSMFPDLVAGADGRLMIVWRTKYGEQRSRKELQFLASPDRGVTWPGPPRVLNQGGGAMSGGIAAGRDGLVVAAWYDERRTVPRGATRASRGFKIYVNRSEDSGLTWLPDGTELSGEAPHDEGGQGAASRRRKPGFISALPVVAADGRGGAFVAWIDNREGRTEVYFRASTDDGKSWGPEINVSRGALSATNHQLLTDGENGVFLVWADGRHGPDDVFFARSEDGGKHWTAPTRLSRRPQGKTVSTFPHMALDPDGRVYVAWQDRRNGREDIYMNISADRGKTWLERDIRLDRDDPGTGISRTPYVVARKGKNVAVVWSDDRSGFDRLLLNWSGDGGSTWLDEEVSVDDTIAARDRARNGRLAWDETGVLHAVWEVWKGDGQSVEKRVQYRRLTLTSDRG